MGDLESPEKEENKRRLLRKYYTQLGCPCCGKGLRKMSQVPLRYGCINRDCNKKHIPYVHIWEREIPYFVEPLDDSAIMEPFYYDSNPIFGNWLGSEPEEERR